MNPKLRKSPFRIQSNEQKPVTAPQQNSSSDVAPLCGKAIAGFVISIISCFLFGFILGIIGICLSGAALGTIGREKLRGKGFAIAGLVISIIGLVLSLYSCVLCYGLIASSL